MWKEERQNIPSGNVPYIEFCGQKGKIYHERMVRAKAALQSAMNPIFEDFSVSYGVGQVIPITRRRRKVWI